MYNQIAKPSLLLANEHLVDTTSRPQIHPWRVDSTPQKAKVALQQLLSQYHNVPGWIVLIAPEQVPGKAIAKDYQLSLNNVLVVHAKQISDIDKTLLRAVSSTTCKVVINFAKTCPAKLDTYRLKAQANDIQFYQAEHLQAVATPH